jgi:hypothetical protein
MKTKSFSADNTLILPGAYQSVVAIKLVIQLTTFMADLSAIDKF